MKKNEILDFVERDTARVFSVRGRMRLGGAAVYLGTVPHTGEEAASACSSQPYFSSPISIKVAAGIDALTAI